VKHRSEMTEAEELAAVQRVSRDLLAYRPELGVNTWGGIPHPAMLIWAGRILDFLEVAESIVGFPPARRQSYDVGYRSGWEGAIANAAELAGLSADEAGVRLALFGNRILVGAGWGRCTIEYDSDAKSVVWEFPKGTALAQAARLEGTREHVACPFISGYIAGWTNRALGAEIEVREAACVARGDPACRFESTPFLRFREGPAEPAGASPGIP